MDKKTDEEKEIRKLRAEISLIRSKLNAVEKEKEALKQEKSKYILNKNEIEHSLKRKLEIKEKEDQIMENQRKMIKSAVEPTYNSSSKFMIEKSSIICSKFILEKTLNLQPDFNTKLGSNNDLNLNNLNSEHLNRCLNTDLYPQSSFYKTVADFKFFKDFFFDDFYSIPDVDCIKIVDYFFNKNQKDFVKAFELFSCKKTVFLKYSPIIFDDNSFVKVKLEILSSIQPEWITQNYDTVIQRFINKNKENLLDLFANFAEKTPYNLEKIFTKEDLNQYLINKKNCPVLNKILFFIAKNNLKGYFDHTNLHLVPQKYIKMMYSSTYFEVFL